MMKRRMLLAVLCLGLGVWVSAEEGPVARTVGVTGEGEVRVAPDEACVTYCVEDQCGVDGSVPDLVAKNKARVEPSVEYLKSVVGSCGRVTAVPSLQQVQEYDREAQKYEFKGYKVVTTIQATLEGKENVEKNLGFLYDTTKIKADTIGNPVLGLTPAAEAKARQDAIRLAVANGVENAKAYLEPGESLGIALERGTSSGYSRSYYAPAARAPSREMGRDDGTPVVRIENERVRASVNFVFRVQGRPTRMGPAPRRTPPAPRRGHRRRA